MTLCCAFVVVPQLPSGAVGAGRVSALPTSAPRARPRAAALGPGNDRATPKQDPGVWRVPLFRCCTAGSSAHKPHPCFRLQFFVSALLLLLLLLLLLRCWCCYCYCYCCCRRGVLGMLIVGFFWVLSTNERVVEAITRCVTSPPPSPAAGECLRHHRLSAWYPDPWWRWRRGPVCKAPGGRD